MNQEQLRVNTFCSKEDYQEAFLLMIQPVRNIYQNGENGLLNLGVGGAVYSQKTQHVEAFLRPLWAIGPYLVDHDDRLLSSEWMRGIVAGTDPMNPSYWGKTTDYDQLLVEMAALSTTLLLAKEKTWDTLSTEEQNNLYEWLIQINQHKMPQNNWLFFRVLVNLAMRHCTGKYSQDQIDKDLDIIESFYLSDGWYCDGYATQIDYYVSFAIHYYSLLYCKFYEGQDNKRIAHMKERAILFAKSFQHWFDARGEALPFGRSLTYRFAQASFWSALVFADVEALPWGEIKGILSRHMQSWCHHDIFSTDGLLTIGYHYPNLVMAEGYNAPGSPYWSFKTFLLLAIPNDHPFWQADCLPFDLPEKKRSIPEARMHIRHSEDQRQLQAYVVGQLAPEHAHGASKYSKLVYSSTFGFSVSKDSVFYPQGGFDNCLALAEQDMYFRTKVNSTAYSIADDRICNEWTPWPNVQIKTIIVPLHDFHVRIHYIQTGRDLTVADGGFSVPNDQKVVQGVKNDLIDISDQCAICRSLIGETIIHGIQGYRTADVIQPEPNCSLFFEKSMYPALWADLPTGAHTLVSLVGGIERNQVKDFITPSVSIEQDILLIKQGNEMHQFALQEEKPLWMKNV